MKRVIHYRPTIRFIEFDWGYLLAYLLGFIYGGILLGYWVFPLLVVEYLFLSRIKKKDPEAFKVLPKSIKGKALRGTHLPLDLVVDREFEVHEAAPRRNTILTIISSIKKKEDAPFSDISALKQEII